MRRLNIGPRGRLSRFTASAALTALVAVVATTGPALAVAPPPVGPPSHLTAVGPTNGENGFPAWYKDSNNLSMGLCLDGSDPLCGFKPGNIPDPTKPVSFPGNFPTESFYMLASSRIDLPAGRALLTNGLQAAFTNVAVTPGAQITFGRVRIRIDTPNAGHFKVTHPYGVDEFDAAKAGTRTINYTEDIGRGSPGVFTGALKSRINPFLRWDTGFVKAPDGSLYLGDPGVRHRITGSALGTNFFRIEGPNIGGPGVNVVTSDLFALQGKVATKAGVAVLSTSYTQTSATGGFVDVFASSQPQQAIEVSGAGLTTTKLAGDAGGRYFARVAFSGGTPPTTIKVSNTSDRPRSDIAVTVTDQVLVTKAAYDADAKTLTVNASSSDGTGRAALTVTGFGPLNAKGSATFTNVAVPPPTVTVTSSRSGSGTAPVLVTGAASKPNPVVA
jgi:hypothetical protein